MSEPRDVQRLALSGLLGTLMMAGVGPGHGDALAAGLHRALPSLASSSLLQAQSSLDAQPSDVTDDGAQTGDDVPFSELNEALSAARSRLAELAKAAEIAKVAGELREQLQLVESENRQLKSVLDQVQSDNSELHSAKQAATRQIEELDKTGQIAAAEARRLDEELVAMRWQNSQLSTSMARAENAARESAEEVTKIRAEFDTQAEVLAATAEGSAVEISQLKRELGAAQEAALLDEQRQAELDTELVELRKTAEEATADSTRLARDLDHTITELANTRTELVAGREAFDEAKITLEAAEQETGILREQVASNRTEAARLRSRLKEAETDIDRFKTTNADLEQQVDLLKTAAGEATKAARLNLIAVEDQIDEINAALASVKDEETLPSGDGPAGGPAKELSRTTVSDNDADRALPMIADTSDGWVPRPSPARATIDRQLIVAASPDFVSRPAANTPLANRVGQKAIGSNPAGSSPPVNLANLIADLPPAQRQEAQGLLAGFDVKREERGLSMTVPGAALFAVNSEQIEPSAHDALASVAELVNLYDGRDVLIVGHTDAVGDAGYNKKLSERRAALVKTFFVENFQIDASRIDIEGQGEQKPITSNATLDGRNANRRVEVVILN